MSERTRNIIVGLTTLLGIAGLCFMLAAFGFAPRLFDRGYDIRIGFEDAAGINVDSRVKLNGIDVGRVTKVQLVLPQTVVAPPGAAASVAPPERDMFITPRAEEHPDVNDAVPAGRPSAATLRASRGGVLVTVRIDENIRLPRGVTASIQTHLIGGTPTLSLDISRVPTDEPIVWLPTDGSALIEGRTHGPASQFARELQGALEGPMAGFHEFQARFDGVADSFERLSEEWRRVGERLNEQLEVPTAEAMAGGEAPRNLAAAIARTNDNLDELGATLRSVRRWTDDEDLRRSVGEAAANTAQLTKDLQGSVHKVNQLADASRENIDQLTKRYLAVADDLSGTIGALRQTLDLAREGEGTLGRLLKDPAVYNNLNDSLLRVQLMIDELQLLIEKWRDEGVRLRF